MAETLPSAPSAGKPLVYAHLGHLHITDANVHHHPDLLAQLEVEGGQFDFDYLPGDVAGNGRAKQYRLVAAALRLVSAPVHIILGNHGMEPGRHQPRLARAPYQPPPRPGAGSDAACAAA